MKTKRIVFGISTFAFIALGIGVLAGCSGNDTKTVSFNTNGGTHIDDMEVEWGSTFKAEDIPETTKVGYTFTNWYADEGLTSVYTTSVVEDNFTLYAGWKINSYNVSYFDGETALGTKSFEYGKDVDLTAPTKENYTFAGWFTSASCEAASKVGDKYKMPAKDVTLYAGWEGNYYNVSFNINCDDGYGKMEKAKLVYDTALKLPKNIFTRTGYAFNGWNTAADGSGTSYGDGATLTAIKESGDITLYAQWKATKYNIVFYNNNSILNNLGIEADYNSKLVIPSDPAYTLSLKGYDFKGWGTLEEYRGNSFDKKNNYFMKENNTTSVISLSAAEERYNQQKPIYVSHLVDNYIVKGVTNLYAVYERKLNTITFDTNGGNPIEDITKYYGETVTLPVPVKAGNAFDGWTKQGEAATSRYIDTNMPTESITLVANWNLNNYSLHFAPEELNISTNPNVPYGAKLVDYLPTKPEKVGYGFDCWCTDALLETPLTSEDTMPVGGKTLYARWNTANVTLNIAIKTQNNDLDSYSDFATLPVKSFKSEQTVTNSMVKEVVDAYIAETSALEYFEYASNINDFTMSPNGNNINVKLDLVKHNVTFVRSDTSASYPNEVKVPHGTTIPSIAALDQFAAKKGNSPLYNGEISYSSLVVNDDLEVTITYEVNPYGLTLNALGGKFLSNNSTTKSMDLEYGKAFTVENGVEQPRRDGYTFSGWYFDDECSEEASSMDDVHDTIYAEWLENSIDVVYHDASSELTPHHEFAYSDAKDLPMDTFSRLGYTLTSWNTESDGSGTSYLTLPVSLFSFDDGDPSHTLNLYAQWTVNKITVKFYGNTSDGGTAVEDLVLTYDGSGSYALSENTYTKTGYHFNGWNTVASGNGTPYTDSIPATEFTDLNRELALYAQWTINSYTMTFVMNGGDDIDPITVNYGAEVPVPEPHREYFKFAGWYTNPEFEGTPYTITTMPLDGITLYAKWNSKPLIYSIEGYEVYAIDVYDSESSFMDYIEDIYGQAEAYDFIYDALSRAINDDVIKLGTVQAYIYTNGNQDQTVYYVLAQGTTPENAQLGVAAWNDSEGSETGFISYVLVQMGANEGQASAAIGAYNDNEGTFDDNFIVLFLVGASGGQVDTATATGAVGAYHATDSEDNFIIALVSGGDTSKAQGVANALDVYKSVEGDAEQFIALLTPSIGAEAATALYEGISGAKFLYLGIDNSETLFNGVRDAGTLYSNVALIEGYCAGCDENFAYLPLSENAEYYAIISSAKDMGSITTATSLTSEFRGYKLDEFNYYEASAYTPRSNLANHYFDGWTMVDGDDAVYKVASFTYRLPTVIGFLESHTSQTVTFTWDPVLDSGNEPDENVWGYEVTITRKKVGQSPVVGEPFRIAGVTNTSHQVKDLDEGEEVTIKVVALFKDGDNFRRLSKAYQATSIADGRALNVETHDIVSLPATYTYINQEPADIDFSDITAGDYYYIDPEHLRMYLFTSGTLNFTNATSIEAIGGDETLVTYEPNPDTVKGGWILKTGNKIGTVRLRFTTNDGTKDYTTNIYPLLNHLELGSSYRAYNSADVTSTVAISTEQEYLAPGAKETFKVGRAVVSTSALTNVYKYSDYQTTSSGKYYYNGMKLDFVAKANDGSTINNANFNYDVILSQAGTPLDVSKYFYDKDNKVIYFLEGVSGNVEVKVYPSATENIYVPNALLKDGKAITYAQTFNVYVGDGFNTYSNESLQKSFGDKSLGCINLLSNIEAYYNSRMVAPVQYLIDEGLASGYALKDDNTGAYYGEVDIVNNTAYMVKNSSYNGAKYKLSTSSAAGAFSAYYLDNNDEYTTGYFVYASDGTYYIDHGARYENNITSGRFKIMNETAYQNSTTEANSHGLEIANVYSRHGACDSNSKELTVNGNYFVIDASSLPCVVSEGGVSAGTMEAKYHIQHSVISIFSNSATDTSYTGSGTNKANVNINNLTVYGNTTNTSKYSSGSEQNIKTEMELRSGGVNGFTTRPWTYISDWTDAEAKDYAKISQVSKGGYHCNGATSKFTLNSVNVYNTLIGLYTDTNCEANYTRVDNSWANGVYGSIGYTDSVVDINHCAIGASGGAAVDHEDRTYRYNPTINISSDTVITNMVSGEEPWFKGYQMEVVALKLKGQFENMINQITTGLTSAGALPCKYTMLQVVSTAGLESEQMNFAYFGQCKGFDASSIRYVNIEGLFDMIPNSYPNPTNYPAAVNGFYMNADSNYIYVAPNIYDAQFGGQLPMCVFMFSKTGGQSFFIFKMPNAELGCVVYGMLEIYPNP